MSTERPPCSMCTRPSDVNCRDCTNGDKFLCAECDLSTHVSARQGKFPHRRLGMRLDGSYERLSPLPCKLSLEACSACGHSLDDSHSLFAMEKSVMLLSLSYGRCQGSVIPRRCQNVACGVVVGSTASEYGFTPGGDAIWVDDDSLEIADNLYRTSGFKLTLGATCNSFERSAKHNNCSFAGARAARDAAVRAIR
jgi:hypothetical protein